MENHPQLFMKINDFDKLNPIEIPHGLRLVSHADMTDVAWETLVQSAFGTHFSFDLTVKNGETLCGYSPEHTLYLTDGIKPLATATATEHPSFPREGWFRMIATSPDARGKGYGRLICLAALHSLKQRGYTSAVLSTDDYRTPAIRTYLSLGFQPLYTHPTHKERWDAVLKTI